MKFIIFSIVTINLVLLFLNHKKQNTIMSNQEEAAMQLGSVATQLAKANTEIQAKIQELVDAAANAGSVTPELQAAIDALVPAAQSLDDIVPDVATEGDETEPA